MTTTVVNAAARMMSTIVVGMMGDSNDGQRSSTETASGLKLGPVLDFMRTIWALDHEMQVISKRMQHEHGVTGQQRLVIRVIGEAGSLSAGEVAAILHLHPSTLTGILHRLKAGGLIHQRRQPDNRRRHILTLTAAGQRVNELHEGTMEAVVKEALEALPQRDVDAARVVIETLLRRARDTADEPLRQR